MQLAHIPPLRFVDEAMLEELLAENELALSRPKSHRLRENPVENETELVDHTGLRFAPGVAAGAG